MLEIGKLQRLNVVKIVDFGIYLNETRQSDQNNVLLPMKQVPKDTKIGDALEVFIYKDSSDRIIATTNTPALTIGEIAPLKVKEVTNIGAFLDWGLEKDLLLPFKEQTTKVEVGQEYLVSLYLDKSKRLCATMKIYHHLRHDGDFKENQHVTGRIYEFSDNFGVFVAVEDQYHGLIPKKEVHQKLKIGQVVNARIVSVRNDGKLDLSLQEKAYIQMDKDAKMIMDRIEEIGGRLPFTDKANPELIKKEFGLSKNAFKRAVGRLLKQDKITIKDDSIFIK